MGIFAGPPDDVVLSGNTYFGYRAISHKFERGFCLLPPLARRCVINAEPFFPYNRQDTHVVQFAETTAKSLTLRSFLAKS